MSVSTIFIVKSAGWGFPYVKEDGSIEQILFGPGLNEVHDEKLFDQVLNHPLTERKLDLGHIVLFDGRVESKESDLGLQLADVKGLADGVPVADVDDSTGTKPAYRKSSNTDGTKKKSTKKAFSHGEDIPLPSIGK